MGIFDVFKKAIKSFEEKTGIDIPFAGYSRREVEVLHRSYLAFKKQKEEEKKKKKKLEKFFEELESREIQGTKVEIPRLKGREKEIVEEYEKKAKALGVEAGGLAVALKKEELKRREEELKKTEQELKEKTKQYMKEIQRRRKEIQEAKEKVKSGEYGIETEKGLLKGKEALEYLEKQEKKLNEASQQLYKARLQLEKQKSSLKKAKEQIAKAEKQLTEAQKELFKYAEKKVKQKYEYGSEEDIKEIVESGLIGAGTGALIGLATGGPIGGLIGAGAGAIGGMVGQATGEVVTEMTGSKLYGFLADIGAGTLAGIGSSYLLSRPFLKIPKIGKVKVKIQTKPLGEKTFYFGEGESEIRFKIPLSKTFKSKIKIKGISVRKGSFISQIEKEPIPTISRYKIEGSEDLFRFVGGGISKEELFASRGISQRLFKIETPEKAIEGYLQVGQRIGKKTWLTNFISKVRIETPKGLGKVGKRIIGKRGTKLLQKTTQKALTQAIKQMQRSFIISGLASGLSGRLLTRIGTLGGILQRTKLITSSLTKTRTKTKQFTISLPKLRFGRIVRTRQISIPKIRLKELEKQAQIKITLPRFKSVSLEKSLTKGLTLTKIKTAKAPKITLPQFKFSFGRILLPKPFLEEGRRKKRKTKVKQKKKYTPTLLGLVLKAPKLKKKIFTGVEIRGKW